MNVPYLVFKKVTNNFSDDRIIGRGGFGDVYKGELENGELIAVKMLHPLQGLDEERFKNEFCNNLFKVGHPNITGLLGYCDEIHSEFVEYKGQQVSSKHVYRGLCFEYFPNGSLHKHLDEQSLAPNWTTRYSIIKGICQGLNFLHGCKPPIFHLDLKPDNILMDNSMVPKLADFGLSRLFRESHSQVTQQRIGTDKYMPQEYRNEGKISGKYDVFSLGVVMIEIMEGYSLFQEMDDVTKIKHEVLTNWSNIIKPKLKYRPQLLLQVKMCIDIAMCCVDSQRKNRPTMASILEGLNKTETYIPNKQIAIVPLSATIDLKNSLAETLKIMTSDLENKKISATNMEQVPVLREASLNVEEPLITERTEDRETSSYVDEGLIMGRTEEKKKILSIFFESITNEMVIVPIYGIGGIGKTTLAQLVFNDTQFHGYSRVWVYVSEKLDLNKIGNSIISQLSKENSNITNMQIIKNRLGELFADKRILIVLDDLWEDKPHELNKLKDMLRLGKGRKLIIVTTRDKAIANKICSTVKHVPYKLEILTNDMCWVIIKQSSEFENRVDKKQLEQIGMDIAIKCGGVPLAAQSLGYMLRDLTSDQWESVRNSHMWNLSSSEDPSFTTHEVLASLQLSYSYMHGWLQSCFSYCAFFPKGYNIVKYDLIHQWIALELTEPSKTFDAMQLCELYITKLLGMSFLQYSMAPSNGPLDEYATLFTMHDLVHDLASATLADKVNKNGNVVGSSCQNVMLRDPSKPLQLSLSSPENIKVLRFVDCGRIRLRSGAISPAKSSLLVLDLSKCLSPKLPNSIGELNQLRYLQAPQINNGMIPKCITKLTKLKYLNLARSCKIEALPDAIGDMKGLMHLDLSGCEGICKLPVSFQQLKQLVYLDLSYCPMPLSQSLGGFTKLQYLNLALTEEQSMKHIKRLPKVINSLSKLRYLNLSSCLGTTLSEADIQDSLVGISTLYNLEYLNLSRYRLQSMPESIGNLTKLHTLDIWIYELPAWMDKMVGLKIVKGSFGAAPPGLPFAPLPYFVVHVYPDECSSNLILLEPTNPYHLEISRLENVISAEEAQSIKLIKKQRMKYLTLKWTEDCEIRYVDDKDVLEKLLPPNTVTSLNISGYMNLSFPTNWLMGIVQYLPNVTLITLKDFPMCNNLPPLSQLPNLEILNLIRLGSLEEWTIDSGGELVFPKLHKLCISDCPRLRIKPCLPELSIEASDNMVISRGESVSQTTASSSYSLSTNPRLGECMVPPRKWRLRQHVSSLLTLNVSNCSDLTICSLGVIQHISSLETLDLEDDILTELPTWFVELTSLQTLSLALSKLKKLNDIIRQLPQLQSIGLHRCRSMESLPQWLGELTSLEFLGIWDCNGIKSLPLCIGKLPKFKHLHIDAYYMTSTPLRKMFSSIPDDMDEIDIEELKNYYMKEEGSSLSTEFEESTEGDLEEEYAEEDIYKSTDYEESIEEDIEEQEENINSNFNSVDVHGIEEHEEEDIQDHEEDMEEDTLLLFRQLQLRLSGEAAEFGLRGSGSSYEYEVNIREWMEDHEENRSYSNTGEEYREGYGQENIYESTDNDGSTEEDIDEHEEDNITTALANAAALIRSPSALSTGSDFQDDVPKFMHEVLTKWSSMIEPTPAYRSEQLRQVKMCIDTAMRCVDSQRQNRPTIASILNFLNETETDIPNTKISSANTL